MSRTYSAEEIWSVFDDNLKDNFGHFSIKLKLWELIRRVHTTYVISKEYRVYLYCSKMLYGGNG